MEISGKIIEVLPQRTGTSQKGEWTSQQFVLETIEQYPKKFLFDVFGSDKIAQFAIQKGKKSQFLLILTQGNTMETGMVQIALGRSPKKNLPHNCKE